MVCAVVVVVVVVIVVVVLVVVHAVVVGGGGSVVIVVVSRKKEICMSCLSLDRLYQMIRGERGRNSMTGCHFENATGYGQETNTSDL